MHSTSTRSFQVPVAPPIGPPTWVVYLMTIRKRTDKISAVCEQSEWDAIELARPGLHQFVCGGFATEREAETLARSAAFAIAPPKR